MWQMRGVLVALLGSAALVVAGCGSSHAATSSSASADPTASLAPKDAGAFVVVDTDQSSAQWKNVEALLAKIPGGQKSLDGALSQLGGAKGLDFTKDVAPAFGKQLVVVVPSGAKDPILLVQPDDSKKLDALLAKDTKPHVTGDVDGWTAVATTQKAFDSYKAALAKGTLTDESGFTKAMDGLPADSLARGYVNGAGSANALGAASGATQSLTGVGIAGLSTSSSSAANQIGTIGFAASATDHGFRLDGSLLARSGAVPTAFTPSLLDRVPADALVAVTFDGAGQGQTAIDKLLKQGGSQLQTIEKQLGVKLDDLVAALDGEGVLYVRAGAPIPEITLAVKPKDAARAKATFGALVGKLGSGTGSGSALPIPGFQLTTASADGVVFVSTAKDVASSFAGSGAKLTTTARFKAAARELGFGGKTSGLGYVDVHALGPLLKTALGALGGGSGSTTSGLDGLSAFDTAIFDATVDGSRTRFAAVVNLS
jgi:hypothetical protein